MLAGLRRTPCPWQERIRNQGRNRGLALEWRIETGRTKKAKPAPRGNRLRAIKACFLEKSGDLGRVELEPVVQVIQVDGVLGVTVGQSIGRKNSLTGRIIVVVSSDGIIESTD